MCTSGCIHSCPGTPSSTPSGAMPSTSPSVSSMCGMGPSLHRWSCISRARAACAVRYLIRLLTLYYQLLMAFFHVGRDPGLAAAGVHLVLNQKSKLRRLDGSHVHLGLVRCRAGNWGFSGDPAENVTYDLPAIEDFGGVPCDGASGDTSAGLVMMSESARHWTRDVASKAWLERLLAGRAPDIKDGLSEQIAACAKMWPLEPRHFASPEGRREMARHGRHAEPITTMWCAGLVDVPEKQFLETCCAAGHRASPCFWRFSAWFTALNGWPGHIDDRVLTEACCFPSQAFCPAWLNVNSVPFILNMGILHDKTVASGRHRRLLPSFDRKTLDKFEYVPAGILVLVFCGILRDQPLDCNKVWEGKSMPESQCWGFPDAPTSENVRRGR